MKQVNVLGSGQEITTDYFNALAKAIQELQQLAVENVTSPLKKFGNSLTLDALPNDFFYAKLTGESNGEYAWSEYVLDGSGDWELLDGGRSGTLSVDPAKEFSGAKRLYKPSKNTYVLMFLLADGDNEPRYRFVVSKTVTPGAIPGGEGNQLLDLRRKFTGDVPNGDFVGPCYLEQVDGNGDFIPVDYRGRLCYIAIGAVSDYTLSQATPAVTSPDEYYWGYPAETSFLFGAEWDVDDDQLIVSFNVSIGSFTHAVSVAVFMEAGSGRLCATVVSDNGSYPFTTADPAVHLWVSVRGGDYLTDDDEDVACPPEFDRCLAKGTATVTSDGTGGCALSGTYNWDSVSDGGSYCSIIFKKVGGGNDDWVRLTWTKSSKKWTSCELSCPGVSYGVYTPSTGLPLTVVNGRVSGTAAMAGSYGAGLCVGFFASAVFS